MKRFRSHLIVAVLSAAIAIQFAPAERSNPRVIREVQWDSPRTEQLARRACFDCHSNETDWPWYAYVAPVSWRVSGHVVDARRHLNFSNWAQPNESLDEIFEVMEKGEMPLSDYLLLHGQARLSDEETQELLDGLRATYEADPPIPRRPPGPSPAADSTMMETIPDSTEAASPTMADSTVVDSTASHPGDADDHDDPDDRP